MSKEKAPKEKKAPTEAQLAARAKFAEMAKAKGKKSQTNEGSGGYYHNH